MYRLLFLLFPLLFFTSCAKDPLELRIIELDASVSGEGFTALDFSSATELDHEDLTLRFSFRADAGAKGRIMVRGKYALDLPSMVFAGSSPNQSLALSPGIWHDVEVQYIASAKEVPAIAPVVYLNGNPIFYQLPLPSTSVKDGPLRLIVDKGNIEIADARYAPVAGRTSVVNAEGIVELNVPLLHYEYFHLPEGSTGFDGWQSSDPFKSGYINRVDLNSIRERSTDYAVRFTGTLSVPETAAYYFNTWGSGKTDFFLDGRLVAGHAGAHTDWETSDSLRLKAGDHELELRIVQHNAWNVNRISYRKAGTEEEVRFLNAMEERVTIATPAPTDPRILVADAEPFLLRSFLYFPAPKIYEPASKRTHIVSVGEERGPHYSVDLQTGALLQVWRGDFADVHEMWEGRGEPQVMRPLGVAIQFDGTPLVAASAENRWPSAPDEPENDNFQHLAYELGEDGRPTFIYDADGHSISDRIIPEGDGLLREITHSVGGNGVYYAQLAAARSIRETAPGEYVLRSPGLTLSIDSYDGAGLTLQRSGGLDRLIAELPAKGFVRYRMDW